MFLQRAAAVGAVVEVSAAVAPASIEAVAVQVLSADQSGETWRRCVDTYLDAPDDICSWAMLRSCRAQSTGLSRAPWSS
jgi:hypothetical protein